MLIKHKNKNIANPGIGLLTKVKKASTVEELKIIVTELIKITYFTKATGVPNGK